MTRITLNDEQAKAVHEAQDTIELRDRQGGLLGYMSRPPCDSEIAEAQRRLNSQGPWHTSAQVLDHLDALDQE